MARKRIDFSGAPPENPRHTEAFSYTATEEGKRPFVWRFSSCKNSALTKILATKFAPIAPDVIGHLSIGTVKTYRVAWQRLGKIINNEKSGSFRSLHDLTTEHLDAVDQPGLRSIASPLFRTLKLICEVDPDSFREETRLRLWQGVKAETKNKPREPLPEKITQQLARCAAMTIEKAKKRIFAERKFIPAMRRIAEKREDFLRLKALDGERLSAAEREYLENNRINYLKFLQINSLTPLEGAAFLIAIAAIVEMPIECIKNLRRDCLINARGGNVTIEYAKKRTTPPSYLNERTRDGGISTAGGLIRLLLDLTSGSAEIIDARGDEGGNLAFIGSHITGSPLHRPFLFSNKLINTLVQSWNLSDEAGKPITSIATSRFRKSNKQGRLLKSRGNMRFFATDHSIKVAGFHYATLEAQDELHKLAIESAQNDLMSAGMSPHVLDEESESDARSLGVSNDNMSLSASEVNNILDGDHDVLLNSCLEFFNSPMEVDGGVCTVSMSACLHCRNAVFHRRKLPSVLAYLEWIGEKRSILTVVEWLHKFGKDWARIVIQILPSFSQEEIAAAWKTAKLESRAIFEIATEGL